MADTSSLYILIDSGENTLKKAGSMSFLAQIASMTYSGLHNVFGTCLAPFDSRGVTFRENADGLAINDKLAVLGFDRALEAAMGRVVFKQINLSCVATSQTILLYMMIKICNAYHVVEVKERATWQGNERKPRQLLTLRTR